MFHVLKSHSAAERLTAATEFVRSFPPATELLIIGASRDAVDDFVVVDCGKGVCLQCPTQPIVPGRGGRTNACLGSTPIREAVAVAEPRADYTALAI
jgi:hypothetical protein